MAPKLTPAGAKRVERAQKKIKELIWKGTKMNFDNASESTQEEYNIYQREKIKKIRGKK